MSDKKIKVVFGVNDFMVGGVQKQFVEQVRFFDCDRFEIILITLFQFSAKNELYADLPQNVHVHKIDFSSIKDVKNWKRLCVLLKELNPDIVVSNLFFSNTVFRVLKPLVGYVSIACEHNTYTEKTFGQRFCDKVLSFVSYKIVAVSKTVADFTSAQEGISIDKFVVIHNGVDISRVHNELDGLPQQDILKQELGFKKEEKIVLNVARLTPQKNQLLLIEAFAQFLNEHPEHVLVIVGEGGWRKKLEEKTRRLGIAKKVHMPGYRPPFPYYAASDFFALTSTIEGFAIVGIEAMACGLPVISTKTAGPDEYINEGENGFFIENENVSCVVDAMEKVVSSDLESLRSNARATAQGFDIRTNVERYSDLFIQAVKK